MSEEFQNKSKKLIIYVSIIVLLALLLAFGPVFFAKYMRNKDINMAQKLSTIKTKLKVKGVLKVSNEDLYLLGNNSNIYLIIGNFVEELKHHLEEEATIMGAILSPEDKKIEGEEVRFVINVDKYGFPDLETDNLSEEQKDKINKRAEFVDEINTKLKKRVRYDVIKGKIELKKRIFDNGDDEIDLPVIRDEFGDVYVLTKRIDSKEIRDNSIYSNNGKVVICLGKTTLDEEDIPLAKDEVVFEVFEMYDENLNKIK